MVTELKQIARNGLDSILSVNTPNILDVLLGRNEQRLIDFETLINEIKTRVSKSINDGYPYEGVTEESELFLRKNVLHNMKIVVLYVDLVCSTSIILKLPKEKLATVLSTFAQEVAYVIKRYNGFVLKFVGDAVIGYFVEKNSPETVCERAVSCAESILKSLKLGVNPVLVKNGIPALKIKIGIDHGEITVVRYGNDPEESHVDILGPSINIAAKLQHLAKPDQIMIGDDVYQRLADDIKNYFVRLKLDTKLWNYRSSQIQQTYPIFAYVGKSVIKNRILIVNDILKKPKKR